MNATMPEPEVFERRPETREELLSRPDTRFCVYPDGSVVAASWEGESDAYDAHGGYPCAAFRTWQEARSCQVELIAEGFFGDRCRLTPISGEDGVFTYL